MSQHCAQCLVHYVNRFTGEEIECPGLPVEALQAEVERLTLSLSLIGEMCGGGTRLSAEQKVEIVLSQRDALRADNAILRQVAEAASFHVTCCEGCSVGTCPEGTGRKCSYCTLRDALAAWRNHKNVDH